MIINLHEVQIKRITVNLPPDIHLQLKLHAVASDTTISNCVLAAIKEHLQHECNDAKVDTKSENY